MHAFVPLRVFLGRGVRPARITSCLPCKSGPVARSNTAGDAQHRVVPFATLSARERRRVVEHTRISAHKAVKAELDVSNEQILPTYVMIPLSVRQRCSLTPRLARVKVFLQRDDVIDFPTFRARLRSAVVRLFPELEERRLLRPADGFEVRFPGAGVVASTAVLHSSIDRCDNVGSPLYVELIPHNTPPPRPPLSPRASTVQQRAKLAEADAETLLRMVSFYKFVDIPKPAVVASTLAKTWGWMGIRGRVYVAREGINAQLAIPDPLFNDFSDAMSGTWVERGEPVIPREIVGVFLNVDRIVQQDEQPFVKLSVKPRKKILADGLSSPLNWAAAGREISANEWHELLKDKSEDVVLLDCRNDYESDVGRFDGAEALNTKTFRDTWEKLEHRLDGLSKDTPILTYCTGGIRCAKVNAFLEQEMGFSNTGRLEGGIVSYARTLREQGRIKESTFKGVNHVFDGRMGEIITDDLLDCCINCGSPCNVQTDCANVACDRSFEKRIFVQCAECSARLAGACSDKCYRESLGQTKEPSKDKEQNGTLQHTTDLSNNQAQAETPVSTTKREVTPCEEYADAFSEGECDLLKKVRERTIEAFPSRAHIMSSRAQGLLLKMLVQMSSAKRILEVGTFTGYATICMAHGLLPGGEIVTCESDNVAGDIAREMLQQYPAKSAVTLTLLRGDAHEILQELQPTHGYDQFDFVFLDADKGGYEKYLRTLLDRNILRIGGTVVIDNVLFRGEVAETWKQKDTEKEPTTDHLVRMRLRNLQNVRKTAQKLHDFNEYVLREQRVEQVLLPFRDGLTIARRKS